MSFFLNILKWLASLWLRQTPAPSQEAVQAAAAATAETELKTQEKSLAQIAAANMARDAVSGRFLKSGGLRAVEQSDPNNRDNA